MSTTSIVQQFVTGLKSRNRNMQNKAAQDLFLYVKTELREMSQEELVQFFDDFNHQIFSMVMSTDVNEKKGGVLAIKCLISGDVVNTMKRITPYYNHLRDLLPCNDVSVMEIAARTLVKLANLPGSKGAESFEFDIKRAFEWLSGDRHEYRRHAAVFILRELAVAMPTYFYQQISTFFDHIFNAIFDPKPAIRESAGEALRAALIVTSQRENTKQSSEPQWYKISYKEACKSFNEDVTVQQKEPKGMTRDDRIHGSMIVFNELFRCSNATWERRYNNLKALLPDTMSGKWGDGYATSYVIGGGSNNSGGGSNQLQTIVPRLKAPFVKKLGSTRLVELGESQQNSHKFNASNVLESSYAREVVMEHYTTICDNIIEQRLSKSPYVQQALLQILPRLAAINRSVFVQKYLNICINHLLTVLKGKEKDRNMAYITIGYIAVAVERDIDKHLKTIMLAVKMALPPKDATNKRKASIDPAIFACITLLANAVKTGITEDVRDILDQMFSTGLSPALTVCLRELAENVPYLKSNIAEGLSGILSQILMNKPVGSTYGTMMSMSSSMDSSINLSQDVATIVLALRTLGTFNFEEQNMLEFVQRCADYFINHEQQEIRLEAVQTCTRLLKLAVQQADSSENSKTLSDTVAHVIERLLIVAITDMDCNVRVRILRSLDETFDAELAQPESLSALFITLNDEIFEIRELAMVTIGRLSAMNPAYVMPKLRRVLVQLLTELEHSGMSRNKEQSARMLDHLVISTPRLISSYMNPILTILVPKLRESESNPGVILNVLRAVGDLAEVNGGSNEMELWADDLLSILLEMLGDAGSPDKRGVALWTLGQLISATGRVVTPYHKYPVLIDILINFLKTEQRRSIRRETIRVLGLLGAMDPYKHKMNKGLIDSQKDSVLISLSDYKVEENQDISTAELLVNMGNILDEYYPAVAIAALMRILRDPTLSSRHTSVVQAVTYIFQSLGIKCVPYLSQVLPSLLENVRTANNNLREFLFQQLAILVEIVRQHIITYMNDIFKLIKEFWTNNTPLQSTLINLIEQIAVALGGEFRNYLAQLIPQILRVLQHDNSKERNVTKRLLQALQKFGNNLDDYLHLIVPPIVKLFDSPYVPQQVSLHALETIDHLAWNLDFTDFSSRIIHPLVRVLDSESELRDQAMSTLCSLVIQLGKKYLVFAPLVNRTIAKHRIVNSQYEKLMAKLQSNTTMCLDEEFLNRQAKFKQNTAANNLSDANTTIKKLNVSTKQLCMAWEVNRRVSKDDWVEWLKRLSIGLLRESRSHALRACRVLAEDYDKLLRDLFNAAFISCWTELSPEHKNKLTESLIQALQVTDMPEITQTILNLAEFMEHCDKDPILIDPKLLGTRAMACRAYAKALRYKEEEFMSHKDPHVFESLILINNKLQQKEAAEGLLTAYRNSVGKDELKVQGRWYEKLHNWDQALIHYQRNLHQDNSDLESRLGGMRCLEALGEWSQLSKISKQEWETFGRETKSKAAPLAAVAAWGLQDWESMQEYVKCIPEDSQDGSFYRAVLAVHHDEFELGQRLIDETRDLLDTELTSMAGESYERAYGAMVCVQMLAELEEVIQYKLIPERREPLKTMWWKRLQGGQRLVEDWRRVIQVHSLVVRPHDDIHTWLKYASLCRKSGSLQQSHKTLVMLLGVDPMENPKDPLPYNLPQVTYAYTKHMAASDNMQVAYDQLSRFVNTYSSQLSCMPDTVYKQDDHRLLARCYLRLATWQNKLQGLDPDAVQGALECFEKAAEYDRNWYKAWHLYAYMNFKVVQAQKLTLEAIKLPMDLHNTAVLLEKEKMVIEQYAVPAVHGFFRSISLIKGNSLQDTLRLLTLWFDYGHHSEVYDALLSGMKLIEINTWLQVIPQLIARIDTHRNLVGQLIHQLLIDIGKYHPQALVYPLTVASKSASMARKNAAFKILDSMRKHSPTLVEQTMMISEELIRVAILWHEQWHEGLEEASRLYFGEQNIKGMFAILEPLHAMLERGPQTLKETSFSQAYGRELTEAYEWTQRYKSSNAMTDLNHAWDIYYHVFQKISRQLPQLTSLELPYVSPKLLACKDLELAVPGSYNPGHELIRISYIKTNLQVITSKQRPRKLCIHGCNGKDYMYLLKGHEDLRQDERVMQLFSLVNTLLLDDPDTFRRNLAIQRYAVIPLSTNSGLIGWVPHCDTLHTLIRDYRDKKKVPLNQEHRTMLSISPDYDHLTLMQKVEVFEYALDQTPGDDLAKLLWLKSPSSEVWFERRTNYTRSLAVMSMVGYILGLGDRHPSNLMLDRMSGKILHIDFGDCFEVAMTREKFPEKIPFRLTRMLIKAMEVTGIEGTYRRTCESVMLVLRRNKDSLMAVLEAFVYDPLLNWRLLDTETKNHRTKTTNDPTNTNAGSGGITSNTAGGSLSNSIEDNVLNSNMVAKSKAAYDSGYANVMLANANNTDATNSKANKVIKRVKRKLTGTDFQAQTSYTVQQQVDLLIQQATNNENLCQCYIGWCPFCCADYFINHEQPEIRLEAVQTCTRLLKLAVQEADSSENSKTLSDTVANVIERLLIVATTDMDCNVRVRILRSLDETFDAQLAQPETLSALFIILNDEIFEIRELAMVTIGRLSAINPAHVMPKLRRVLVQLLTELENSGMSRNKEQSARMLDHLVISTPRLISSYINPILTILVPKLRESESNPDVIFNVLRAVGDLAEVDGGSNEMKLWADDLLSILLEMLGDAGSTDKRGIALWTLGQLISATGRVVTPYHKYPVLIDILINILKTEQRRSIRRETIRVLGLLGAMDPYKHKINKGLIDSQKDSLLISLSDQKAEENQDISTAELLVNLGNILDEYYPAVAIAALMRILRDPTLSSRHTSVVQAVTYIFQSLGIKCVPYLSQVLPSLLENVRTANNNLREFLFQQLAILVEIVRQHIITYMNDIFKLIKEFWTNNTPLQSTLINLIEQIAVALGGEFRNYLAQLIPQILRVLQHDNSKERNVTKRLLQALQKFGNNLDDYLHLIVPPIVKLFDSPYVPQQVSLHALETIDHLAWNLDFTDFSSRIIHPLVRVLDSESELSDQAMSTLCSLVIQLGKKYLVFAPQVNRTIAKHRIVNSQYEKLMAKLQSNVTMCLDEEFLNRQAKFKLNNLSDANTTIKKLNVSTKQLCMAWEVNRLVSKDDWVEWLKRLSIGLLRESRSHALRACRVLAEDYDKLLRDLFNAAFISCWTELSPEHKNKLTESLIQALQVTDMPEITQTILNLAEFMEHCDKDPILIDPKLLGTRAMACRAYAKALRYKEEEFMSHKDPHVFESLTLINNKLQQKEAAEGLLTAYRNSVGKDDLKVQGRWYEKLHNWDQALIHYQRNLHQNNLDLESRLGSMRCLEALGEWSQLRKISKQEWEKFSKETKSKAAPLAAVAAWGLQDWESMQEYVKCIPEDSQDGSFYRAVLAVHHDEFEMGQRLIDETRDLLDTELTSMAGESYERAYGAMVCVQMLAELEEVIQYKLIPERRELLKTMWWKRLQGGQRLVEDWRRVIQVHSLVVRPHDDIHTWLKYASLCRKSGSLQQSHKTLVMLLGVDPMANPKDPLPYNLPQVTYAYTKHMAASDNMQVAYDQLSRFVSTYSSQLSCMPDTVYKQDDHRLLARCYLRLATWQNKLQGLDPDAVQGALECFEKAVGYDRNCYKAWHLYAYMNFKVVQAQKQTLEALKFTMDLQNTAVLLDKEKIVIEQYAVPAVHGFFRSISLIKGNSLQDTLRLLTLWFDYGHHSEVYDALLSGMELIEINTWLQVIPQLIARIDTHRNLVGQLIHQLLIDIGKYHPQALVYPLTVASKSASMSRKNAAFKILDTMRKHSPTLVEQTMMISEELIRVAILWHEQWHEGLEEASRLYFGEQNIKGMFAILEPLHAMLERGPQTLKETSFSQAYGRELTEAYEWTQRYKSSNTITDLNHAWDIYLNVVQRIVRQLPQLTSLELSHVSPKLLACKDMELAVPGSYNPGHELIRISYIKTNLQVIISKQRPRKLCIRGCDGKDYMYLLKGHEDLRQDERVMQLFSLVNTLLLDDPDTFRRNLAIQRYAIIPLSTNSGLIGWVPHCDTLHTLIRDHRDIKKVPLNQEHRIMLNISPDYDHLMLMQKVEVFEYALDQTPGDDLAKLMWLKSPSSEVWFQRRTNYTRSLAVMSMVGYILGLGDRHPSNLMLDRMSGKILHIDFGDCFEVAMTREKFPEKIPFRLTRMLIKAMEVTGIEGTYRRTCESVMLVLRRNKDSLMAVLEAFVYDPLLNWRLLDTETEIYNTKANNNPTNINASSDESNSTENSMLNSYMVAKSKGYDSGYANAWLPHANNSDVTSSKANKVIKRIKSKLTGTDFQVQTSYTVQQQVDLLIQQATSNENLCQSYIGWCPFW